jgi:hypothetical protein
MSWRLAVVCARAASAGTGAGSCARGREVLLAHGAAWTRVGEVLRGRAKRWPGAMRCGAGWCRAETLTDARWSEVSGQGDAGASGIGADWQWQGMGQL